MIDATARLEHYLDHLAPTWRAMPAEYRGTFYVPPDLVEHAERRGIRPTPYEGNVPPWRDTPGQPILVAATQDVKRAALTGRPIAYQGHGVGQSFVTPDGRRKRGYSGGEGYEAVDLFLALNEDHAALWRAAYPHAHTVVVGAPKLGGRPREGGPRGPLVVVSFHWHAQIGIPEAGTAWPTFRPYLRHLTRRFRLALHAHPRIRGSVQSEAGKWGVPFIADFDEVLDTAGVYVNDCSSTLYEFAAFGGPVVVLNAPSFRRDVEHGLRFWQYADVGPNVNRPTELAPAIERALADPPEVRERRREISRALYPYDDPATRAAVAILNAAGTSHPAAEVRETRGGTLAIPHPA